MSEKSPLERYSDTASWQTTDYASITIKCGFLSTNEVNPFTESGTFGFGVSQSGSKIALIAGAHREENGENMEAYTYQSMTPSQARELAATLNHVADEAERIESDSEDESESEGGFLKRLMSR